MKKIIQFCAILLCSFALNAAEGDASDQDALFSGQPATLKSVLDINQSSSTLRTYNCQSAAANEKQANLNVIVNGISTGFVSITECLTNVSITYTCTTLGMRVTRVPSSSNCGK